MTQKKRMLITGVSGLLGNNLAYYFRNKYRILGLYLSHPVTIKGVQTEKVDILSQNSVRKTIKDFKPDVVIHCASLTDVDFCENNRTITRKINIEGCRFIGQALKGSRAKLVYISSDSVYDGKNGNFSEVDPIRPKNYYGLSKYKGELEILKHPDSLVLRTNIFGWNIQNKSSIAEWILEKLKQHVPVKGFRDAEFSSVYTFKLAQIMDAAIRNDLRGVYNCASRDAISKYEFAVRLARSFKLDPAMIRPISIDTFGFKASRGKNLSLDTSKLRHDLHCALPTVQSSLDAFRRDFRAGLPGKIR
ncbi:MAG: SDR family oxidoreductase, partial [Candidatus Omnitrophica bacterium]|nr:SDR family oxidoreductase [Candidatus Omnitrophota bacterium]